MHGNTFGYPSLWFSSVQTATMIKQMTIIVHLGFSIVFLFFSYDSLLDYINGTILFDAINDYNELLAFPLVTVCPKQEGTYANFKLNKIREDFNLPLSESELKSPSILWRLVQLSEINYDEMLQNYSFSKQDIFNESNNSLVL